MTRVLFALCLLCAPMTALAADDLKISQLEQEVRNLQRQVQALSRQIEEVRSQQIRSGDRSRLPPASPVPASSTDAWLDASRWQRVQPGMNELEVISLLGPPTTMREEKGGHLLLYALEISATGFLGGSVRLRDRVVVAVQKPVLQ